jgi:hypothetical protein
LSVQVRVLRAKQGDHRREMLGCAHPHLDIETSLQHRIEASQHIDLRALYRQVGLLR